MKLQIADKAGACYGVERALKLVEEAAKEATSIHTLGPLIHNPQVVSSLEQKGVAVSNEPDSLSEGTVVLRSHGVALELEHDLRERGLDLVDATCPFVKRAHLCAQSLSEKGYFVIIVGDEGHAEVEGISSYVNTSYVVTTKVEDLKALKLGKRVGLVVQTTQSQAVLQELCSYLLPRVQELRIFNTICEATQERQEAAASLATSSDLMIVVGGKNSGNTKRLYEICKELCPRSYHIESSQELQEINFNPTDKVGITAGASTPAYQIAQVVEALQELSDQLEATQSLLSKSEINKDE